MYIKIRSEGVIPYESLIAISRSKPKIEWKTDCNCDHNNDNNHCDNKINDNTCGNNNNNDENKNDYQKK